MPPLNQSNWIYGISDLPMSSYLADSVLPTSLVKFVTADQQTAAYTVNKANNEGESTGTDWGTEQWIESHDVNIPFTINPTIEMLGRLLFAALGQIASTAPVVGVGNHVITPQDANTSRQLPAFWFLERFAARHNKLYPSCVLEKLSIKGDALGKLNASGNFRGSGKQLSGAGITINPETNKYYLKNTMSKVQRAAAATPGTILETVACGLQNWAIDIDNAPDANLGYDPGCGNYFTAGDTESGVVRSFHYFGRRKYTSAFEVWLEDSDPALTLLRNQTPVNLKMGQYGKTISTTYKNQVEFELALAYYSAVDIGNKNGYSTLRITPEPFYDETANKILAATVQNARTSYTS